MDTTTVAAISALCLTLGLVSGFAMHRSDFCLAGMFRDLFLFGSSPLLRSLALAMVVTMLLLEALRWLSWLPAYPFLLLQPASLATLPAAVLFGIGMVLAGGCVVGTLYKMGAGNAPSWAAFAGLIAGSALYAEVHPDWSRLFESWRVGPSAATLPAALGVEPLWFAAPVTSLALALFWRWHRNGGWSVPGFARGYLQPWKTALLLSAITAISYAAVGMPVGITTFYAKLAAVIEAGLVPEHVEAVAFFSSVPLDAALPHLGIHLRGGPGPRWDAIAFIQGSVILGIVLGAFVSAALLREFRIIVRVPLRQYLSGFLGGLALALGSRMACGCNVWYLLGGLPTFASQSLLFLAGMLGGTWIGSALLTRLILPSSEPAPSRSTP